MLCNRFQHLLPPRRRDRHQAHGELPADARAKWKASTWRVQAMHKAGMSSTAIVRELGISRGMRLSCTQGQPEEATVPQREYRQQGAPKGAEE